MTRRKTEPITFEAAWASNRKCFQADTDGEVTLTWVVPESDSAIILALYQVTRGRSLKVTVEAA